MARGAEKLRGRRRSKSRPNIVEMGVKKFLGDPSMK
jgi:hypothetical protein